MGLGAGLLMLYDTPNPLREKEHFGGPLYPRAASSAMAADAVLNGIKKYFAKNPALSKNRMM